MCVVPNPSSCALLALSDGGANGIGSLAIAQALVSHVDDDSPISHGLPLSYGHADTKATCRVIDSVFLDAEILAYPLDAVDCGFPAEKVIAP